MECFKRFRNIDSHFASKQILNDFERSNHRRVNLNNVNSFMKLILCILFRCSIVFFLRLS